MKTLKFLIAATILMVGLTVSTDSKAQGGYIQVGYGRPIPPTTYVVYNQPYGYGYNQPYNYGGCNNGYYNQSGYYRGYGRHHHNRGGYYGGGYGHHGCR